MIDYLEHDYTKYYTFNPLDTIICLGATNGEFCRTFRNELISKEIRVINVEPTNTSFAELEEFTKDMPMVTNINKGVWSTTGQRILRISDNPICNMISVPGHEFLHTAQITEQICEVIPLDHILLNLFEVNLLTCDIEGCELEVFLHSRLIRKVKQFAIASYHVVHGRETIETLLPFFESLGYETRKENIQFGNTPPSFTMLYAERI